MKKSREGYKRTDRALDTQAWAHSDRANAQFLELSVEFVSKEKIAQLRLKIGFLLILSIRSDEGN